MTKIFRSNETHKAALRSERRIREMEFASEEDKKKFNRYGELAEKLQVSLTYQLKVSLNLTHLP